MGGAGLWTNTSPNPCQEETRLNTKLVGRKRERTSVCVRESEREHGIVSLPRCRARQEKQRGEKQTNTQEKLPDKSQIFSPFHTQVVLFVKNEKKTMKRNEHMLVTASREPKLRWQHMVCFKKQRKASSDDQPPVRVVITTTVLNPTELDFFHTFLFLFCPHISIILFWGSKAQTTSVTANPGWKQKATGSCNLSKGKSPVALWTSQAERRQNLVQVWLDDHSTPEKHTIRQSLLWASPYVLLFTAGTWWGMQHLRGFFLNLLYALQSRWRSIGSFFLDDVSKLTEMTK